MKVVDKGTVRDTLKIESGITYNIGPINHKQRQLELPHTDTLYIRTRVRGGGWSTSVNLKYVLARQYQFVHTVAY